jgi:hypothetical protein
MMMNGDAEEIKIARRVQKNLRRIGVASTIEATDDMITVSGKDSNGKPFAVRIGRRIDNAEELDAFADECDRLRTHPRQPNDLILVCLNPEQPDNGKKAHKGRRHHNPPIK